MDPSEHHQGTCELADRLHSVSIRLLRRLRQEDVRSGLTGPRLSALSVIVHEGPITMGRLAATEQVRPATMTRLVRGLERQRLVQRSPWPGDRRAHAISATRTGIALLREGRNRRVASLVEALGRCPPRDRRTLGEAVGILERLTGADCDTWSAPHPGS